MDGKDTAERGADRPAIARVFVNAAIPLIQEKHFGHGLDPFRAVAHLATSDVCFRPAVHRFRTPQNPGVLNKGLRSDRLLPLARVARGQQFDRLTVHAAGPRRERCQWTVPGPERGTTGCSTVSTSPTYGPARGMASTSLKRHTSWAHSGKG